MVSCLQLALYYQRDADQSLVVGIRKPCTKSTMVVNTIVCRLNMLQEPLYSLLLAETEWIAQAQNQNKEPGTPGQNVWQAANALAWYVISGVYCVE